VEKKTLLNHFLSLRLSIPGDIGEALDFSLQEFSAPLSMVL
jgi:hypothetical protein